MKYTNLQVGAAATVPTVTHGKNAVEVEGELFIDDTGFLCARLGNARTLFESSDRRTKQDGTPGAEGLKVKFPPKGTTIQTDTKGAEIPQGIRDTLSKVAGRPITDEEVIKWNNEVEFRFGGWAGCWLGVNTLANRPQIKVAETAAKGA